MEAINIKKSGLRFFFASLTNQDVFYHCGDQTMGIIRTETHTVLNIIEIFSDKVKNFFKKYFYTARREDNNVVYSWHELEAWQFKKKNKTMNAYKQTGEIK